MSNSRSENIHSTLLSDGQGQCLETVSAHQKPLDTKQNIKAITATPNAKAMQFNNRDRFSVVPCSFWREREEYLLPQVAGFTPALERNKACIDVVKGENDSSSILDTIDQLVTMTLRMRLVCLCAETVQGFSFP